MLFLSKTREKAPILYRTLVLVHIILPAIGILILLDFLFWGGSLKEFLPTDLQSLLFYTVVFNLPHIIASFFCFADKEYLVHYKKRFLREIPILLGVLTLLIIYSPILATRFFLAYTLYHVVSQQIGIFLNFTKGIPSFFTSWKWAALSTLVFSIIYGTGAGPYSLKNKYPALEQLIHSPLFLSFNLFLLGIFIVSTLLVLKGSKTIEGKQYGLLTSSTFLLTSICMLFGYPLLGLLAIRVVHDLTAFVFYITHENNRNAEKVRNPLYAFLYALPVPFAIIVPTLAILMAYPLTITLHTSNLFFLILVSCLHYYTEGFVWRRGTIHREQIYFKI